MIVKGGSVSPGHGNNLANYLLHDRKNERSELIQLRGSAGKSLEDAVQEWSLTAAGTRCKLPIYSASINPRGTRSSAASNICVRPTSSRRSWPHGPAAGGGHPSERKGREHAHVVWSRIDIDRMRAISDSNNFRKHELAARSHGTRIRAPARQGSPYRA